MHVKEDKCVLLARETSPFSMFEVSEQNLVSAFGDYLRRLMPSGYATPQYRNSVIEAFTERANQIEAALYEAAAQEANDANGAQQEADDAQEKADGEGQRIETSLDYLPSK